jgi:hypothetical protein
MKELARWGMDYLLALWPEGDGLLVPEAMSPPALFMIGPPVPVEWAAKRRRACVEWMGLQLKNGQTWNKYDSR